MTSNIAPKFFFVASLAVLTGLTNSAVAQTPEESLEQVAAFFQEAQLIGEPTLVDCTLSGGDAATCFSITVKAEPTSYTPGPWCPTNISQGAESGGIWMHDGEVHDVDGEFITKLAELYGDTNWQLFDPETGDINFTGTLESCEAAARPDVDPEYQNHCVQCLPEYMPDDATMTYTIPIQPLAVSQTQATNNSGSGVAYNGVRLDGPAPLEAILSAYTIAPFDDCGGHVNTHVGYHYHAVTDCLKDAPTTYGLLSGEQAAEHGTQIGLAMDGYQIFSRTSGDGTVPSDLDACSGHGAAGLDYHYHAGEAGSNAIVSCLMAQAGCASEDPDATCDASARRPRP